MQPRFGIPEFQHFGISDGLSSSPIFGNISGEISPSSQANHIQKHQHFQEQFRGVPNYFQNLHSRMNVHFALPTQMMTASATQLMMETEGNSGNGSSRLFPFLSPVSAGDGCGERRYLDLGGGGGLLDEDATDRRWTKEVVVKNSGRPGWLFEDPIQAHEANNGCSDDGDAAVRATHNLSCKKFKPAGVVEDNEQLMEGKGSSGGNIHIYGELEAICNTGNGGVVGYSGGEIQTGSGSALTGDNNKNKNSPAIELPNDNTGIQIDLGSETSAEELAPSVAVFPERRKQKRRRRDHLEEMAAFFQRVVSQLIENQESMYKQFMDALERQDVERRRREEERRREEAERLDRERTHRAQYEATVKAREAAIIQLLEKITGQPVNLPARIESLPTLDKTTTPTIQSRNSNSSSNPRWPPEEVNTLIDIRFTLEPKFREPGLKGPLWEQVSTAMAARGYGRNAKRCKEKWENILKYKRKAQDGAGVRKRSPSSKTCSYFDKLDTLFSAKSLSGLMEFSPEKLPQNDKKKHNHRGDEQPDHAPEREHEEEDQEGMNVNVDQDRSVEGGDTDKEVEEEDDVEDEEEDRLMESPRKPLMAGKGMEFSLLQHQFHGSSSSSSAATAIELG